MTLLDRIARELETDAGGDAALTLAANVIDAITEWAAENPTEAAPWEEHFRGVGGEKWEYQFQHKFPRTVLVSEDEAALIEAGFDLDELS